MAKEIPDKNYIVSNVMSAHEVQVSKITFTDSEESSTPVVKEKFDMEDYRELNKVAPTKVRIAFAILMVLVLSLFLAVIALCIAFSVEIPRMKSEPDSVQQQSSISAAIMNRLDNLNSSMDGLSQQLLQIDSQTQQVASSLLQEVNSSLELLSQQLRENISEINDRMQQLNSSQQMLSQQLHDEISAINSRMQQINSSQQMLSQQLSEDISAIDSRTQQINSSQQMLFQQLREDITAIDSRTQQINSSQQILSMQLSEDISAVDSRTQQINSSQQLLSQQLREDITAIDGRMQQINSSQQILSMQLSEDISAVDSRTQQVNSSQQTLSQQLREDITAIDSRIQQINSSQLILSMQLLEDISAFNSRIEQVNVSLLQQVNDVETQAQETVDRLEAIGELSTFPASSCAAILSSLPSGFYYVRTSNGSAVRVYCDMSLSCGGVSGGWMRVVEVDFNDSSTTCPSGFREDIDSNLRTCVTENDSGGCYSKEYSTSDITYSSVCGKVIAYQLGAPEAFASLIVSSSLGISSHYLDGISLTYGNPMQHIWSFAVGLTETRTNRFGCPCNINSTVSVMDTFIGTDYFCDSAAQTFSSSARYPNDPLFDGEGCAPTSECCSFNNPPWFYKQLSPSTTDNIEMRVCRSQNGTTENVLIQSIELYIQ